MLAENWEVVQLLLNYGADRKLLDEDGQIALEQSYEITIKLWTNEAYKNPCIQGWRPFEQQYLYWKEPQSLCSPALTHFGSFFSEFKSKKQLLINILAWNFLNFNSLFRFFFFFAIWTKVKKIFSTLEENSFAFTLINLLDELSAAHLVSHFKSSCFSSWLWKHVSKFISLKFVQKGAKWIDLNILYIFIQK